jgi:hypothetical protein
MNPNFQDFPAEGQNPFFAGGLMDKHQFQSPFTNKNVSQE